MGSPCSRALLALAALAGASVRPSSAGAAPPGRALPRALIDAAKHGDAETLAGSALLLTSVRF